MNILSSRSERSMRQALYGTRYRSFNFIKLAPYLQTVDFDEDFKAIKELRFRIRTLGYGSNYFRELKQFSSWNFALEECPNRQDFYKKYVRGRRFNDIRIAYEEGDDYCTILLKDDKEIVRINARLTSGPRVEVPAITKWRFFLTYKRYLHTLSKKEKAHDRIIQSRKKSAYFNRRSDLKRRAVVSFMGPGQQYRSLSLPGFATYNCDQIARMKNPQVIAKRFQNESGERLHPENLLVCDTKVRATFYFYRGVLASCSKRGLGFAILNDKNKSYYLTAKDWIPGQALCTMKELPEIEDADELRRLLSGN